MSDIIYYIGIGRFFLKKKKEFSNFNILNKIVR